MTSEYQPSIANTADQRTVGYFPLSIGTALAVENLCGIRPDLPKPTVVPITLYKEFWVNLRTLHRNIYQAMSKDIAVTVNAVEMAQIVLEEMAVIPDMLKEYAGRPVPVVYYFSNLNKLDQKYPEAILRSDTTPKQLLATKLLEDTIKILQNHDRNSFIVCSDKLPGNSVKTLLLSHISYDLLSSNHFGGLDLIDSHTGTIYPKTMWYKKYYNGKELSPIPFTVELLQVFGDKEIFSPQHISLRRALLEIAEKRNWSSVTSRDRILLGIDDLKDPAHKLKMKKIYHVHF